MFVFIAKTRPATVIAACLQEARGYFGLVISLLVLFANVALASVDPHKSVAVDVVVEGGAISGYFEKGLNIFKGVPYAAAPVGTLRWRAPQSIKSWQGVKPTREYSAACLQKGGTGLLDSTTQLSEDCLYLNIWTKNITPERKMPVMVWIHGGSFVAGSANVAAYDGSAFAQQGVVLVNFNYRLGNFGMFAHPALSKSNLKNMPNEPLGNYLIMDQLAVLQWVQKNIEKFGGDPKNVTIFGESAGGASVNALLVSPASKQLFHKAISQSGTSRQIMPDYSVRNLGRRRPSLEAQGERIVDALDLENSSDLVSNLRKLPAVDILEASVAKAHYFPSTDDGKLVPGHPSQIFESGDYHKLPIIFGANSWEGSLLTDEYNPTHFLRWLKLDEKALTRLYGKKSKKELAQLVFGDMVFTGATRTAAAVISESNPDVYLYHFTYLPTSLRGHFPGAPHAMDIPYVFNTLQAKNYVAPDVEIEYEEYDYQLSRVVRDYWVQFSKTGNPNGSDRPMWPSYSRENDELLEIGLEVVKRKNFSKKRLDFYQ